MTYTAISRVDIADIVDHTLATSFPAGEVMDDMSTDPEVSSRASLTAQQPPLDPAPERGRIALVIVAASAGGLAALSKVLAALPRDFPAAIAVVLHRLTRREADPLLEILQKRIALRVEHADTGAAIRPATVYIAPAGAHLRIDAELRFVSEPGPALWYLLSAADPLLVSAAERFGSGVVAVILTGRGRDGASGAAAVRSAGGIVLAQDPATSAAPGMPRAAIATGAVHAVLPLEDIAPRLIALVTPPGAGARG